MNIYILFEQSKYFTFHYFFYMSILYVKANFNLNWLLAGEYFSKMWRVLMLFHMLWRIDHIHVLIYIDFVYWLFVNKFLNQTLFSICIS